MQLNDLITPLTKLQREISLLEINFVDKIDENVKQIEVLKEKAKILESKITPRYQQLTESLQNLEKKNLNLFIKVKTAEDQQVDILLSDIVRFYQPFFASTFCQS